ncbi:MAG: prolyl oligopeptidase family serine peptidase, partial [Balneolales bacterium]|nr:prolyl oligopeptidase family serine peptidase [Balneolales bacterium]
MQFENLQHPVISDDASWIGYSVWPERGDGEARFEPLSGRSNPVHIERGEHPQFSRDARFGAVIVQPPFIEAENAPQNDRPRQGAALVRLQDGSLTEFEQVQRFQFSPNNRWLILHHHRPKLLDQAARTNSNIGSPVTLVELASGEQKRIDFVSESAIDSTGRFLIVAISDTTTVNNALMMVDLSTSEATSTTISAAMLAHFGNITWDDTRLRIAYTAALLDTARSYSPGDAHIVQWSAPARNRAAAGPDTLLSPSQVPADFRLRSRNSLTWTRDGQRLFYGLMSAEMVALDETEALKDSVTAENLYDINTILRGVSSDVWHVDDPLIKTNEKQTWNRRKNHLYDGVIHLGDRTVTQLATLDIPNVARTHNPRVVIGQSDLPYQKLITWDGRYSDYYLIDMQTGEATQIREMARFGGQLSPSGAYYAFFNNEHWYLMNTESRDVRPLTYDLPVTFADEENDRPQPSGSYGIAGWVGNDEAVLIHDKFDIWQFDTRTGSGRNLTNGRADHRIFRIRDLAENRITYARNEQLLLEIYNDRTKNYGFYSGQVGRPGVTQLLEDDARFRFIAKAANSDQILYTRERYDSYPNLWIANDSRFRRTLKVTTLHDDLHQRWKWGSAELISWLDLDGRETQGVVFYPGDYEEGKRYPVMVYYYERFSQRLHDFNHPVTNHRPNTAQYTSDGYIVFYPDVWFDVPLPGYSATKSLVPGVQKLIQMGVADPAAIGLHGHSWSGYLTAHVITQTNIFAAAVAGAPVSNMTSAYSGIRWGTGLARQFQYEQAQSRLAVSMYENFMPYIENSPVFYADRINTPLLIQFGDKDDAVPWEQGIELYLAMRRLGKESVFLQYHGEPHHLRQFANRLDYAIKMKEYFDHYLKGAPAPAWITEGVPYRN